MSTIPLAYNVESVRARWPSAIVAVLGIAGTVAVFVAMLALANGFQATLVRSGIPENALVRRAGATSEMDSAVFLEQVRIIEDAPMVERSGGGPLVSPEVVVVTDMPLKESGLGANVQVRGVSPRALEVHRGVKLVEGRFVQPGLPELVVGRNVRDSYQGLELGSTVRFGGLSWSVVGAFDAGGAGFDSEIWCDADLLNQAYLRPRGVFQSVAVHLTTPGALPELRQLLTSDPRLRVQVDGEIEYYEKSSRQLTQLITGLGGLVAAVMGIGAIFGALNTMYSAVAERTREIATLRALGFSSGAVITSFVFEALLIAGVGGVVGCLVALPINGLTTATMNFQTFSHMAFAFQITPPLLGGGIVFALLMGLLGGVPPAVRAARLPVAAALRDL
ncbi:MAG: ABC transporter permease [Vicinamibacteria bacterium]